jgi:Protein of unknown function (DUF3465)
MINSKKAQIRVLIPNILILLTATVVLPVFSQTNQNAPNVYVEKPRPVPLLDDSAVLTAQAQHAIKVEVSVTARVKKLLPEDVQGLPHERFLIELSDGSTVLIAHDLKMAPAVPINPGDIVSIRGEYIWNKLGGLIHWTHHTDTPKHENGWIDFNNVRYQ